MKELEFGLNSFGEVATDAGRVMSDGETVRLLIGEAQLAESVGLDVFSIGEHYREGQVDSATPYCWLPRRRRRRRSGSARR